MQINKINSQTSFGMAYNVSSKAADVMKPILEKSTKALKNMQIIQDTFEKIPNELTLKGHKWGKRISRNKIDIVLDDIGLNAMAEKTVKIKRFVKKPTKFIKQMSAEAFEKSIKNAEKNVSEQQKRYISEMAKKTLLK